MDISVIICTYNRSTLFRETLDSFFQCNFDGSAYELILVDNGSTDETSAVAQEFVARHPAHVKYIFEKIPDLANARNIAIQAAEGKLIAFLDDDVYLDPDWLREVKNVFARHPEAMCMGGKSIPLFDAGRPDWISDDLMKIYGSTNSGESVKFLKYPEYPFGLNMAFRSEVFRQVGLFDARLGRKKTSLLSNEETELFYRIDKAGLKTIYTPQAVVYHRIPVARAQKEWILQRYYWEGISDAIFQQRTSSRWRIGGLKTALKDTWDLVGLVAGGNYSPRRIYSHFKSIRLKDRARCYYKAGRIRQSLMETFAFKK